MIQKVVHIIAAAMLCVGGISACAQPPSSHAQSEASASVMEEGARAAAAADAAAMGSESKDGNKEKVPVTTETMPEKTVGPPIASTILQDRILRLVDSLRSPSNVTRHHLEEVMQVKLTQDAKIQEWWTHEGITDEGWGYSILMKDKRNEDLPSISIGFSSGESESTDAVVCSYELEAFSRSLVALGYTRYPGFRQPRAHVGFDRAIEGTRFGSSIHVFKYVWTKEAEGRGVVYCVEGMNIYAGMRADGE